MQRPFLRINRGTYFKQQNDGVNAVARCFLYIQYIHPDDDIFPSHFTRKQLHRRCTHVPLPVRRCGEGSSTMLSLPLDGGIHRLQSSTPITGPRVLPANLGIAIITFTWPNNLLLALFVYGVNHTTHCGRTHRQLGTKLQELSSITTIHEGTLTGRSFTSSAVSTPFYTL